LTTTLRLTSKTTPARILAVSDTRASAIEHVTVATRDAWSLLRPGVLAACAVRFPHVKRLALICARYRLDDLDRALATGFRELVSFGAGRSGVSAEALRALTQRPLLTELSVFMHRVPRLDRRHHEAWRRLEGRRMELVFLNACRQMSAGSLSVLARSVAARHLILREPTALKAAHVDEMLARCPKVSILGRSPLRSTKLRRELLARALPGQLEFAGPGRGIERS
jgi:hypothetical protein